MRKLATSALLLAVFGICLAFYSTGQAKIIHTWSDIGLPSTISNGDTISSDEYRDVLLADTMVFGDQKCSTKSFPYSLYNLDRTITLCWFKTNFGLVSDGGTFVVPAGKQLAGFFDANGSPKSLLPTPNPDVVAELDQIILPSGDYSYKVDLVSAKASELTIEYTSGPDMPGTYSFTTKSGVSQSSNLHNKPISYGGSLVWQDNNPLYQGVSFSNNGQWMVLFDSIKSEVLRVNLNTFESSYINLDEPNLKPDDMAIMSITDDGRYLAISIQGGLFRLYPTDGECFTAYSASADPDDGCVLYRDFGSELDYFTNQVQQDAHGGVPKFISDDLLSFYTRDPTGGSDNYFEYYFRAPHTEQSNYIALGDSYASGEGEGNNTFFAGTDINGVNMCHLSKLSYPFLAGQRLGLDSTHSVACSGAKTYNVVGSLSRNDSAQYQNPVFDYKTDWTPGYVAQLNYIKNYKPNIITVSVGGNDIGFRDILTKCVGPDTCYPTYEDRFELVKLINNQFTKLVNVYTAIKQSTVPDARIYVMGYPSIVKPEGNCGDNVRLDAEETVFASELELYLNQVIKAATEKAGVFYVDDWSTFDGHRLCESSDFSGRAVNGITIGHDSVHVPKVGNILSNGSFHPTIYGHQLLAKRLENYTNGFSASMPRPDPTVAAPMGDYASDLEDMPESGRQINVLNYDDDLSNDVVYKTVNESSPIEVGIRGILHPWSFVGFGMHSDPVDLGTYQADSTGGLFINLKIPTDLPTGFHTLYADVKLVDGQSVRLFKTVYVAASPDDLDGDGVPNSLEPCLIFETPNGVDYGSDFDCRPALTTTTEVNDETEATDNSENSNLIAASPSINNSTHVYPKGDNALSDLNLSGSAVSSGSLLFKKPTQSVREPDVPSERDNHEMMWLGILLLVVFTFVVVVRYAMTNDS